MCVYIYLCYNICALGSSKYLGFIGAVHVNYVIFLKQGLCSAAVDAIIVKPRFHGHAKLRRHLEGPGLSLFIIFNLSIDCICIYDYNSLLGLNTYNCVWMLVKLRYYIIRANLGCEVHVFFAKIFNTDTF